MSICNPPFIFFLNYLVVLAQVDVHIPIWFEVSGAELDIVLDNEVYVPTVVMMGNGDSRFGVLDPLGDEVSISLLPYRDDQETEDLVERLARSFDPSELYRGPSRIFLGSRSNLMAYKGPLAIIHNSYEERFGDLVLRSTDGLFRSRCVAGSLMSIRNTHQSVTLHTVEDNDYILETFTSFGFPQRTYNSIESPDFSYSVLSLPDVSLRRYLAKMMTLGAVEPPEPLPDYMNLPTISMLNCSSELVARLPSIRIQFPEENNSMYIELATDDFIHVNESTQTCRLALDTNDPGMVIFNPLRVPFMNVRINHEGTVQICDSADDPGPLQPVQDDVVDVTANAHVPIVFGRSGGLVKVRIDGVWVSDMIIDGGSRSSVNTLTNRPNIRTVPPGGSRLPSITVVENPFPRDWSRSHQNSVLAIGPRSSMVVQLGSVAVLRSPTREESGSLVLRSTRETFASSCVPGTLITSRNDFRNMVMLRFGNYSTSDPLGVGFEIASNYSAGAIADIPIELMEAIRQTIIGLGARVVTESLVTPVFTNCSVRLLSRLPPLQIIARHGPDSQLRLLPSDYVRFLDRRRTCQILLRPLQRTYSDRIKLYPLRIPSMNIRFVRNDSFQVCRVASRPLLQSRRAVLDLVLPSADHDIGPPRGEHNEPHRSLLHRGLGILRCALRVFGCRSR